MKINLKNLCGLASTKRRQTVLNPFADPLPQEVKRFAANPSISLTYGRSAPAWMGGVDWAEQRKRKRQSLLSVPIQSARYDNPRSSNEVPS